MTGLGAMGNLNTMARRNRITVRSVAAAAMLALASFARSAQPEQERPGAVCIRFWGEARYVVGYDHLVHLDNVCDASVDCVVWTDVSPTPLPVAVEPREAAVVLTFRGSPARAFTPFARCGVASENTQR
jgi:hypothetical protein